VKESSGGSVRAHTGSAGFADYSITKSGLHEISAVHGDFSVKSSFVPSCREEVVSFGGFSLQLQLMVLFLSLVICTLGFTAFFSLLETIDPDYPLRQYPFFFSAFFAAALLIISFLLSLRLPVIASMSFDFVLIALLVLLVRYLKGKRKVEDKGRAIEALSFLKLLPDSFDGIFGRIIPHRAREQEMEKVKRQISKRVERFRIAGTEKRPEGKQHALEMAKDAISSFNSYLLVLTGSKKPEEPEKAEVKKSPQQIVEERRVETMIADIGDQLSRDGMAEGQEEKPKEAAKGKVAEKVAFISRLIERIPALKKTGIAAKPNISIELFDELGNALKAKKAEFYLEGKKVRPVKIDGGKASFKLKKGKRKFYVRLLGFVDFPAELDVGEKASSTKAKLPHGVMLSVADAKGNPLDDAFINIVSGKKKAVDINAEFIWKTPCPKGAPSGTALIPLNPLKLPGKMLSVKIVKANYSKKEILIPSQRVSSAEQLKKAVELEKIVKD